MSELVSAFHQAPNEAVEKANFEPGGQDLESYFCRCRLSCRGAYFYFNSIYSDPQTAR